MIRGSLFSALLKNSSIRLKLIIIILLLFLWIGFLLGNFTETQKGKSQFILTAPLSSFDKILFQPVSHDSFSLERLSEKDWALVSYDLRYPSCSKVISQFLDSVKSLHGITLTGENEKMYNISPVPSLVFYEKNNPIEAFFLGNRDMIKKEIYLRRKSDGKTFLISDISFAPLSQGITYLADSRLFPNLRDHEVILMKTTPLVQEPSALPVSVPLTYTKTPEGWVSSLGEIPLSASFSNLNHLKAIQILPAIPLNQNPQYKIEITWANGYTETLIVYQETNQGWLIEKKGNPYGYLLDPASLKQFYHS